MNNEPKSKTISTPQLVVYVYVGEGAGVPGMPHEITRDMARSLGVLDILETAIAAGVYKAKE